MTVVDFAAGLVDKIVAGGSRRAARRIPFRPHLLQLDEPVVAFTFDDFPLSAAANAAPVLEDAGMRGTYYYSGGLAGNRENGQLIATDDVVADLAARGHEIGAHTHDHLNVQRTPIPDMIGDVNRNIEDLERMGASRPPASFAYPYGVVSLRSKLALMNRFAGLRGISPGINSGLIDLAHLRAQELYDSSSSTASMGALLDQAERRRGWLIFYTHEVCDRPTEIGCSPAYFRTIVDLVKRRGIRVETVARTLRRIGATPGRSPVGARQGQPG
ncbi:MAG: polysaccharide deacetylase family protein [Flavobacteriaceae bacterium]